MANILVTGGAGNIGSALTNKLATARENRVVVADNLLTGSLHKLPRELPNVRFVKCDVNRWEDIAPLFFVHKFDFVFHFAAVVGVQRTLDNPLLVLEDIKGIENVLKLSKNTGVQRVFFSSSSEVYGEPFEIPQNEETTPLNSRLPYAVVKNVAEAYLKSYQSEFDLSYTIFRFFNTYGPNQTEDFVLPRFVRLALAGEPLSIYGDGSQTRTFCYVDDTVGACLAAHEKDAFINDVVNVGGAQEMSIRELAELVIRECDSKSELKFLPPLSEGDMTRRCPDVTKMLALLDHSPVPLEEGIGRLRDHFAAQTV
jgi:nucleoside-diphosphate-sugar epimerase